MLLEDISGKFQGNFIKDIWEKLKKSNRFPVKLIYAHSHSHHHTMLGNLCQSAYDKSKTSLRFWDLPQILQSRWLKWFASHKITPFATSTHSTQIVWDSFRNVIKSRNEWKDFQWNHKVSNEREYKWVERMINDESRICLLLAKRLSR